MRNATMHSAAGLKAAALVLAVTAAGCAVGPNYERPKLEPPAQHRGDGAATLGQFHGLERAA